MCGLLMSLLCIPPVPSKLSNGSSMQNFADTASSGGILARCSETWLKFASLGLTGFGSKAEQWNVWMQDTSC